MVKVEVNENAAVWDTDIMDIDFTTRAKRALARKGMFTLRDVMNNWNSLGSMRHIGEVTLKDIRSKTMKAYTDSLSNEQYTRWLTRIAELN